MSSGFMNPTRLGSTPLLPLSWKLALFRRPVSPPGSITLHSHVSVPNGPEASVCKAKRQVKRKRVLSTACATQKPLPILGNQLDFNIKLSIINGLKTNPGKNRRPAPVSVATSYFLTSLLPPPVSSQSPYTAAKPRAPQSTHPPADNSPPLRSTSFLSATPSHLTCAQTRS